MTGVVDAVKATQEIAAEVTPVPGTFDHVTSADDLKARLDWGEPALTIIDIRSREAFNDERITGAIPMSVETLTQRAPESLEKNRDIYIYGDSDESAAGAATQLATAGFERVAVIEGGLKAWKQCSGPVEGRKA